jgi:large subunit ribosomal protein L18
MLKLSRNKLRLQRKRRISAKLALGTPKPRLAVFKSLTGIAVQVIDDAQRVTLVSATTKVAKLKNDLKGAGELGKLIAKKCLEKKITAVVFDRAGYKFHGKVKAVAEGAREAGLKL